MRGARLAVAFGILAVVAIAIAACGGGDAGDCVASGVCTDEGSTCSLSVDDRACASGVPGKAPSCTCYLGYWACTNVGCGGPDGGDMGNTSVVLGDATTQIDATADDGAVPDSGGDAGRGDAH